MDSCRTCLREPLAGRGYFLFDPTVRPAVELLTTCTSLKILKDDGLPVRICDECYAKLSNFLEFCKLSIEADIVYRKNRHVKVELAEEDATMTVINSHSHAPALFSPFAQLAQATEAAHPTTTTSSSTATLAPNAASEPVKMETHSGGHGDVDVDDNDDYGDADAGDNCKDERGDSSFDDDDDDDDNDDRSDGAQAEDTGPTSTPSRAKSRRQLGQSPRKAKSTVRYQCDMCDKKFLDKSRLTVHLRQHCGLRPYQCDQCPKEYDSYTGLHVHKKNKHAPPGPDEPTQCSHEGCDKVFRLPKLAQNHYERVHLKKEAKTEIQQICETCGKSFPTRARLVQHMRTHMDVADYPHQCDQCGKRFPFKSGYTNHMLRHENIRNYACPECPVRFVAQVELNYHMEIHAREPIWACEECPSKFNRKPYLRRHVMKVHRGIKPFVCTECGRAFAKQWTLKNHALLHTGEKPHACQICGQRFVQLVTLKTHMKVHNGKRG